MKIETQIKNLLARYGKVSLPGRGVFRCVSEGARVEDGKILPPLANATTPPPSRWSSLPDTANDL